jgi:release factor glutamine methyltransferase
MTHAAASVACLLDAAATRIVSALHLEKREARLEARVLAAFAWKVAPAWLIAHDTDALADEQVAAFETLLARRLAGEPVAYLTSTREFFGQVFEVSPDVLIPRPETELLVELALARLPADRSADILDLGTGSGCIAISLALERPHIRVTAIDRSMAALDLARRNAERLGARVEFLNSDWFDGLAGRHFDLVVSNPPYIAAGDPHLARGDVRFEPLTALAAGADGLDDLRRVITGARTHLHPGGVLLLEHGYDQAAAVRALLMEQGFANPESWRDLAGTERVSGATVGKIYIRPHG